MDLEGGGLSSAPLTLRAREGRQFTLAAVEPGLAERGFERRSEGFHIVVTLFDWI